MGNQHTELSQHTAPVFRVHVDSDRARQRKDIHTFRRQIRPELQREVSLGISNERFNLRVLGRSSAASNERGKRFDFSCEKEYVEVRDGGTDSAKLFGRYCKDVAPSSMISTQNMMYVRFYTDVPEPKNGFKAVFSIKGMVLCKFCPLPYYICFSLYST